MWYAQMLANIKRTFIKMKKSVYKPDHVGSQPIRVLKHNLTHKLIERNQELIKKLHTDLKLTEHIKYNIAELAIEDKQTPFIDENGEINIHESFLSYLWSICYSMLVFYEEGIAIPDQIKRGIPTHKENNPELIEPARKLFQYARSMVVMYSDWDKDNLPNPEFFDEDSDEGWYVLRANHLYIEAMNFILCHEIAHAELQHIKTKQTESLSKEQLRSLELEADTRAINLMLENSANASITGIALVSGIASMLFLRSSLDGGAEHPDIDERLKNILDIIKPEDDSSIWPLLVLFINQWDRQFSFNFSHKAHYANYKELYYELIEQAK
jgi:hypothetical protein